MAGNIKKQVCDFYERANIKVVLLVLIALAAIFWGKEIRSGFFADDFNAHLPYFNRVKDIPPLAVVEDIFAGKIMFYYRPLSDLVYYLKFLIFGNNPTGYVVVNIIAHLLISGLIYWFVNLLFGEKYISLFSAALFCFFFRHFVTVKWISQTRLVALFLLLSVIMFLYFRNSGRLFYYFISLLCFTLALFSQENAVIIPFLALLTFIYNECHFELSSINLRKNRKYFLSLLGYFIIGALYLFLIYYSHLGKAGSPLNDIIHIAFNVPYFFVGLVIPFGIGKLKWALHHFLDTGEASHLLQAIFIDYWYLVLVGMLAVIFIIFIILNWRRYRDVLFGLAWICLAIAPFVPFVGNANRYFYIPSIGYGIILGSLIKRIRNTHVKVALSLLILILNITILSLELKYWNFKYRQQAQLGEMLKRDYPDLDDYDVVLWEDKNITDFLKKYKITRVNRTLEYLQMERSKYLELPPLLEISEQIGGYIRWLYASPNLRVFRVGREVTEKEIKDLIRKERPKYIYLVYDGRNVTPITVELNDGFY